MSDKKRNTTNLRQEKLSPGVILKIAGFEDVFG